MKTILVATIALFVSACTQGVPFCDNPSDCEPTDEASGSGGAGSAVSSSASSGAGGTGGGTGVRLCEHSGECNGQAGMPICQLDICVNGKCQAEFDVVGAFCEVTKNNVSVCDGKGNCGDFMPKAAGGCFTVTPLQATCPLCDDGDPATHDWCETDEITGEKECAHYQATDGFVCGPYYSVQGGECCPDAPPVP